MIGLVMEYQFSGTRGSNFCLAAKLVKNDLLLLGELQYTVI